MPFDGNEKEWEDKPEKKLWYTISYKGQKLKRKIWQVDILLPGFINENNWWPTASFYCQYKNDAYAIAAYIISSMRNNL